MHSRLSAGGSNRDNAILRRVPVGKGSLRGHTQARMVHSVFFVQLNRLKETVMDKNRVEGAAKQVKGSVKEAIGKVTGNRTTQAEGAAEKLAGKVQSKVGEAADAVRDRVKR